MKTADKDSKKTIIGGLVDLFGQYRRWLLFFGTGSSCALDSKFGMPALAESLDKELGAEADWPKVASIIKSGKSLEQALTGVPLCQNMKTLIQNKTGDFIASIDRSVRDDLLQGRRHWVGEQLLKALTHRLPPRNPRLPVVTANYDMLIEYACAHQEIRCTTGFLGDLIRVWNWDGAQDSLNSTSVSKQGARTMTLTNPLPRVELFKVHGSINRFNHGNRQIECDLWSNAAPVGLPRVIAAPGDPKYEQYAFNTDTVSHALKVEDEAMAFAFIGYGFNDKHLHGRILDRVERQNCPLLVMTLELDDARIAELRRLSDRIWILVAVKDESGSIDRSSTMVFRPGTPEPIALVDDQLWSCDSFAERILGG